MEIAEFRIGAGFWRDGRQWRCTDIGRRTITAIRLDEVRAVTRRLGGEAFERVLTRAEAEADGWFNGPPYAVEELVFDENDFGGCTRMSEEA